MPRAGWALVHCCLAAAVIVVVGGLVIPQRARAAAVSEFGYRFAPAATRGPFPVSPAPSGIVAGPDGGLWWTDDGHIGRITTDGQISLFSDRTSGDDLLESPAIGPDGRIWFVDAPAGRIGSIGIAGDMRWYPALDTARPGFPVPVSVEPHSIAHGSDGAMWFTDRNGHVIGRITADGASALFPVGDEALDIAAGPDGALWFTTYGRRHIGRITTAGEVRYFSRGLTGEPWNIVAGPDGALWFTEAFSEPGGIGRITPNGDITELKTPATKDAIGLTVAPDGSVWFATYAGCPSGEATITPCALGRIGADGRPASYRGSILTDAGIDGLAFGADGHLWFTELTAGRIGRLDLDACGGTARHILHLRNRWPGLVTARATLDGERLAVSKRRLTVTVDLRLHPKGTARVRVVGRTRTARHVTMERRYRIACTAS